MAEPVQIATTAALEDPAVPAPPRGTAPKRIFLAASLALVGLLILLLVRELSASAEQERSAKQARNDVAKKAEPKEAVPPPAPAVFDSIKDDAERQRQPRPASSSVQQTTATPAGPVPAPVVARPVSVGTTVPGQPPSPEAQAQARAFADETARITAPLAAANIRKASVAAPQDAVAAVERRLLAQQPDPSGAMRVLETALKAQQAPGNAGREAEASQPSPIRAEADNAWLRQVATQSASDHARANVAEPVKNRLMLRQGETVACVNRERVNTDMPGQLTCEVIADVYDSLTGRCVLVPRGSWMIARYNADTRPGQERVLIAFTRLLRRDGQSVDLAGSGGIDAVGQAGWSGDVDNHFLRMFGASFVIASLAWGVDRTTRPTGGVTVNTAASPTTAAGQVLSDVSRSILDRNRYIPPTITIEQAQLVHASVARDLVLPPARCE